MEKIIKDLERRRQVIEEDKQALAECVGSEKAIIKQLQEEFEIDTLVAGELLLQKISDDRERIEDDIEDDYKRLKEDFPW